MTNEILLIISIILIYGSVLLWLYLFGADGLMAFTSFATIAANIEALMIVNAFGMQMTLGNILFASTFLITDILSELYGKEASKRAVNIGILTSLSMILLTCSWMYYKPAASDWAHPSIKAIFSNTPRLMFVSLFVYGIVQKFDVWLYHKWWDFTEKKCGDRKRYLWLRNNGSTLISQFLNNLLFTFGAFIGMYSLRTIVNIVISSYVIFIFTSLADTPIIYLARKIPRGVLNKSAKNTSSVV
ncbi:MAG: queuosine precursor transporter [Lachnospiraceae bacterium]|nr:queuosine precursor transporter [Lachnospiraceae bacterium]